MRNRIRGFLITPSHKRSGMEVIMGIAENILRLRIDSGLTQEQLAEKLSVSRQAVSKWEMGVSQS